MLGQGRASGLTIRRVAQALGAFASIWLVIAAGWVAAHLRIIDMGGMRLMSNIAFLIASPALMFNLVGRGSLEHAFSQTLIVSALAVVVAATSYLVFERVALHQDKQGDVIGTLCSCYTNAGNLGLPIAISLLGDGAWMAPIMLMQVGFMQPIALAALDLSVARRNGERLSALRYITMPFRNPITAGILAGLAVNLLHLQLPEMVASGVSMVGQMAIPMMLMAFGVSLRLSPLPGKGPHSFELWVTMAIKLLLMPLAAIGIGMLFGLARHELFAVAVIAALPTAQNVFVISARYRVREMLARDAVFWSTILTVPTIVAISALLG